MPIIVHKFRRLIFEWLHLNCNKFSETFFETSKTFSETLKKHLQLISGCSKITLAVAKTCDETGGSYARRDKVLMDFSWKALGNFCGECPIQWNRAKMSQVFELRIMAPKLVSGSTQYLFYITDTEVPTLTGATFSWTILI